MCLLSGNTVIAGGIVCEFESREMAYLVWDFLVWSSAQ